MKYEVKSVGIVECAPSFRIRLESEYAAGLTGLDGFSHVSVVWYADKIPAWQPNALVFPSPYKGAPEKMGVFATRTPFRPNGICVSTARLVSFDCKSGILELEWIDAEAGTPVLDIKPYHPSEDRVLSAHVPDWAAAWPASYEASADFPWEDVFLF